MNVDNKYFSIIILPLLLLVTSQAVSAEKIKDVKKLPTWEIGLGVGAIHQPYYTGTKQIRQFAFPIVSPTFRGKYFKSDDKGLRAQLFKSDRLQLDLSADLNLAIDSDEIDLREGLDDIDNIVQFGPSFEVLLNKTPTSSLFLNIPVRGVFKVGSDVEASGFNISPNLHYRSDFNLFNSQLNFTGSIGPQFGSSDYHDIYYGVDKPFETTNRAAYKTDSGYSGSRLQLAVNKKFKKSFLLGFLRYENINGATFDDSPLVETNNSLTVGLVFTRNLFKSKNLVNP